LVEQGRNISFLYGRIQGVGARPPLDFLKFVKKVERGEQN